MFGAVAQGITTVTGFLMGDDCLSTVACFNSLGVEIEQKDEKMVIHGNGWDGLQEPTKCWMSEIQVRRFVLCWGF